MIALVLFIIAWVLYRTRREKRAAQQKAVQSIMLIAEIIFLALLPAIGLAFTANACQEHPFSLTDLPTAWTCWAIGFVSYFISKYAKPLLSPAIIFLSGIGLSFGFLFALVTAIHFSKFLILVWFPVYGDMILSAYIASTFLFIELLSYKKFYGNYLEKNKTALPVGLNSFLATVLAAENSKRFALLTAVILPFIVCVQGLLYLLGQRADSILHQFTESCGFLLSDQQSCSCGGHYLCSVAAFGNEDLVKPSRYGMRGGKIIKVNRQLLIANAFENWFEEKAPRMARVMRRTYDAFNIPADKWAERKSIANVFYVMMKPAEWIFLLWLYVWDKHPENRIERQYLPKQKLNDFIATQNK